MMNPTLLPAGTELPVALGVSTVLPSMDFETYSEAGYTQDPETGRVRGVGPQGKGGLPVVGTPVYAEHPSTEVLCLYYDLKDGKGRRGWAPSLPGLPDGVAYLPSGSVLQIGGAPVDLLQHIVSGGMIEAWNVTFEFWIWNMICVRRLGWPVLPFDQCRCAMAKSRRHSLPGALGQAARVLGTAEKDKEGTRLIQKLCRPITPTKHRLDRRWTPATAWDDFLQLYAYCDRDVETEDCAAARIPDLTPYELETWQLDQAINARGVQVDVAALDACLDVLGQTERKYTAELSRITGALVNSVSEVAKMLAFMHSGGWPMPDMKKDTVAEWLGTVTPGTACHRVLEIRAVLGAANVKKLRTLKLQISSDGRLRDQYAYCGADRTGRASAGGVQLQNITSKGPETCMCESCEMIFGYGDHLLELPDGGTPSCPRCGGFMFHVLNDWTVEAVEFAIADVVGSRSLDYIEKVWGDPIALLCGCLRGLFIAKEGHELVCVDFSAIEAVAAACLSRCQWRIDVFATHGKIYEMSAAKISGKPFEEILQHKIDSGRDHPLRKTVGKVAELASGYGGWIGAWKNFGADSFMDEEEMKSAILRWRDESPEIVDMWGGQFRWCGPGKWDYRPELFGLEGCAINAILHPGQCFSHIDITYGVFENTLFCRLPSGRFLKYHRPRLISADDKLRRGPAVQILFEGYNTNSQKGPVGWHIMETYGGRLFENCIAEGTLVLTQRGWVPIEDVRLSDKVHDGENLVEHEGSVNTGWHSCTSVDGVRLTPDHRMLAGDGWAAASERPQPLCTNKLAQYREDVPLLCSIAYWVWEHFLQQDTRMPTRDILNAGPLHRFVIKGVHGAIIVHNCVQAVSADLQFEGLGRCEARGYPIVMHTHDEGSAEMPLGAGSVEEMAEIMTERPSWASWWPLRAAGWRHRRYQKD